MPLENATFISQLVATNPTGLDKKSQGDDQIRMLKDVLQKTFPTGSRAFFLKRWAEKEAEEVSTVADLPQVAEHDGKLIYFSTAAGSRLYSLLPIANAPVGMIVFLDRDQLNGTIVTIDGSGAELIN